MTIIQIDMEKAVVSVLEGEQTSQFPLATEEAFRAVSKAWLRAGWDTKYVYSFTWLGRPLIQLPEDLIRLQELIYALRPDLIVETGVAHGGSLVFYASMCELIGKGKVVGIDVEIRPNNRRAIEEHGLRERMFLIEGSSTDENVVDKVRSMIEPGQTVLVCLDSNHSRSHVARELELYGPLVSPGSYIVVMDGIMADLSGAPRSQADWSWNNPLEATVDFVRSHGNFRVEKVPFRFNESHLTEPVTYSPGGFVKRLT